ncbi:hypothetical protein [Embleya sp. AB8]|uniref:hypothetical protein n=1 Tax=Embleya sp. AB8 TaxID=3156304 RepID=UPI003C70FF6E
MSDPLPTDPPIDPPTGLHIDHVLGDGLFAQIGKPAVVLRDDDRGLIAIGGDLGHLQWTGRDAGDRRPNHRIGVFDADDLTCRNLARSGWPVNSLALHPSLPLLAIGTGSYDGGYFFEGELLLFDLESGRLVSALRDRCEVLDVRWRDDRVLDLVLAPADDWDNPRAHGQGHPTTLEQDDWRAVGERSLRPPQPRRPPPPIDWARPDRADDAARRRLVEVAAEHGATWTPRRAVWAVVGLPDGRVLAAFEGTKLEAWSPDGQAEWSVADARGGRQILLSSDSQSAWVTTEPLNTWSDSAGWQQAPTPVERLSTADGRVLETLDVPSPDIAVLSARADGLLALRDNSAPNDRPTVTSLPAAGPQPVQRVSLGRYDLINHPFDIRYSPELLFLQGDSVESWRHKWVVAVEPPGHAGGDAEVRRLFPLDWHTERPRHLFGGPGVHLTDDRGPALVHAGAVHDGAGLLPGNAFIVRRRLPDGAADWVATADFPITALDLDADTNTLYAAFNSGELVALDAADGSVQWRTHLRLGGILAEPLAMSIPAPGRLLIGTTDGRILVCRTA